MPYSIRSNDTIMTTLDEIRNFLAAQTKGAKLLSTLPDDYPAYVIRLSDGFGVAVEWERDDAVSEHFASAHFVSARMVLGGNDKRLLTLISYREDLRNEFACVCAQFVDPGENGRDRMSLVGKPHSWWKHWRTLLGNAISDKAPYSVLCEMLVLEHVLKTDPHAEWTAAKSGTHDIESESHSYEVKSTIRRYGASITVSSQFQLLTPKPLDLFFLRVEESPQGVSINDMKDELVANGYDETLLEDQLYSAGYELGSSARDRKYSILEKRVYGVDETFPKITAESFKGDVIPTGVTQITYVVNLEAVPYGNW